MLRCKMIAANGSMSSNRRRFVMPRSSDGVYPRAAIQPPAWCCLPQPATLAVPASYVERPLTRRKPLSAGAVAAALLAPSLVFLIAFTYWPIVEVGLRSLTEQRFGETARWGFGNFARLFADPHFANAAWNSTLYAAGTIVPSLGLALAFAVALRESGKLATVLRTCIVMPLLIPLVAAAALFVFIFLPGGGLLDWHLAKLGIGATNWLGDPSIALGSIIAITVWKNTGYYMLFFLAGLAGIPEELHEAAKLDGAGAATRFLRITLPLLGPTLGFVTVIALLNVLTQIDHVIVMTQGGPSDSTNMLLYYIYQQAEQNYDPGLASAATIVSVAVLLAVSVVGLRALERGMHHES
jgi:sn-glycerol 3-phosphate transport system permease protein